MVNQGRFMLRRRVPPPRSPAICSLGPTGLSRSLRARVLSPCFQTVPRQFSNLSGTFQRPPSLPTPPYQASDDLKGLEWPEEDLTSTADEGAGFYPLRLGETFDGGRFVITRKLGWGGYSTVWLARDRKCASMSLGSPLASNVFESTETIATSCSKSSLHTRQGRLRRDGFKNVISSEKYQTRRPSTTDLTTSFTSRSSRSRVSLVSMFVSSRTFSAIAFRVCKVNSLTHGSPSNSSCASQETF